MVRRGAPPLRRLSRGRRARARAGGIVADRIVCPPRASCHAERSEACAREGGAPPARPGPSLTLGRQALHHLRSSESISSGLVDLTLPASAVIHPCWPCRATQ